MKAQENESQITRVQVRLKSHALLFLRVSVNFNSKYYGRAKTRQLECERTNLFDVFFVLF